MVIQLNPVRTTMIWRRNGNSSYEDGNLQATSYNYRHCTKKGKKGDIRTLMPDVDRFRFESH